MHAQPGLRMAPNPETVSSGEMPSTGGRGTVMQPQAQDASGGGGPGAGRGEKAPPRSLQRKAALPTLRLWPPDLGEQSSVLLISGWSSVIGPSRSPQGVLASRRPKALRTGCRPSGKGRRLLPLLLSGCGVREGHQACLRGAVP